MQSLEILEFPHDRPLSFILENDLDLVGKVVSAELFLLILHLPIQDLDLERHLEELQGLVLFSLFLTGLDMGHESRGGLELEAEGALVDP